MKLYGDDQDYAYEPKHAVLPRTDYRITINGGVVWFNKTFKMHDGRKVVVRISNAMDNLMEQRRRIDERLNSRDLRHDVHQYHNSERTYSTARG